MSDRQLQTSCLSLCTCLISVFLTSSAFLTFWPSLLLFLYFLLFLHFFPLLLSSHLALFRFSSLPAPAVSPTLLSLHHLLTLVHSCQTWQRVVSHWPNQNSVWGGISSKRLLAIGKQLLWSRNWGETDRQTRGNGDSTSHCSLILSAWNSWLVRTLGLFLKGQFSQMTLARSELVNVIKENALMKVSLTSSGRWRGNVHQGLNKWMHIECI